MLSSILNSPRAIAVNIQIMRAFVQMRELLSSNKELARQFAQLESRLNKKLSDHNQAIAAILSAIRKLMNPRPPTKRRGIAPRSYSLFRQTVLGSSAAEPRTGGVCLTPS